MTKAKSSTNSKRQVLLYPGEDGYFVAEVPSLPGCISQGKTREEALINIEEAIDLYIEVLLDRGKSVPLRGISYERAIDRAIMGS